MASEILAVWGAVTGTIGALVALTNARRDRPSLRVVGQIRTDSYKFRDPPALVITVTNIGKQPTPAISEVGLATRWQRVGLLRRSSSPQEWRSLRYGEWPPRREVDEDAAPGASGFRYAPPATQSLKPGEAITAWDWLDEHAEVHAVRPFATDVFGRVSWADEVTADAQRNAITYNSEQAARYG
jgi:hypothetical protein